MVRIRMKKLGRKNRAFFRICVMDIRTGRDGRAIEELGTYDPSVSDVDARVVLDAERVKYWLGVGAKPSDKVGVLIKKYGPEGTHVKQAEAARAKLKLPVTVAPKSVELPKPAPAAAPAAEGEAAPAAEAVSEG